MPKHLTTADEGDFVTSSELGVANGVAQLGSDGKVPNSQLPAVLTGSVDSVNGQVGNVVLTAASVGALDASTKNAPNGVASLDATGRGLASQLPLTAVQTSSLGVPSGVATLGSDGKLTPSQAPSAPVTSVAGKTGTVTLVASDVGALATSARGAANGVASLDSNSQVPSAQIPSLAGSYLVVPASTPTKPGQQYTAVASGSNSGQWVEPLFYKASSAAGMPSGVPEGSLCTRTDLKAVYEYISGSWTALPYVEPWRTLTLASGVRGYQSNSADWLPQVRRIGAQAFVRGRIELVSGNNWGTGYVMFPFPADCQVSRPQDAEGVCTTGSGQIGTARFQLNFDSQDCTFFAGSGPNPNTPWLGFNFSYWID